MMHSIFELNVKGERARRVQMFHTEFFTVCLYGVCMYVYFVNLPVSVCECNCWEIMYDGVTFQNYPQQNKVVLIRRILANHSNSFHVKCPELLFV